MQLLESTIIEASVAIYHSSAFRQGFPKEGLGREMDRLSIWDEKNATGGLSSFFFALELFKRTGDKTILMDLDRALAALDENGGITQTHNYSLFEGRSGLSYFYLEFFKVTKTEKYLEKALRIIKQFSNKGPCKFWLYDNKGLANGMAGTLLLLLALYHKTGHGWLEYLIREYSMGLIGESYLAGSGIYWENMPHVDRVRHGWAYGNSGIAFCLLELGEYFNNEVLSSLARAALQCEDASITPNEGMAPSNGTPDLPFSLDTVGQNLIRLYAARSNGHLPYLRRWDDMANALDQMIASSPENGLPDSMMNGLAGWALAFKEAWSWTGSARYLNIAERAAQILVNSLHSGKDRGDRNMSFVNGLTGIGYSLLKTIEAGYTPSLLFPRVLKHESATAPDPAAQEASAVRIESVNKLIVKNNFKDSVLLLKKHAPLELEYFLAAELLVNPERFNGWACGLGMEKFSGEEWRLLDHSLSEEMALIELRAANRHVLYSDDCSFAKMIDVVHQVPKEEILQWNLVRSKQVTILRKEAIIDLSKPFTREIAATLFSTYAKDSYFLRINQFNKVEKGILGILLFIADLFTSPASVASVCGRIADFVMNQEEGIIALFFEGYGVSNADELRERLDQTVLDAIPGLLRMSVLE